MKNFHIDNFLADLSSAYSNFIISTDLSVHVQFQNFIQLFTEVVNKHALLRKRSRKDTKLYSKPWLTRGIIKSIKDKNKRYSKSRNFSDLDKIDYYKSYRNT